MSVEMYIRSAIAHIRSTLFTEDLFYFHYAIGSSPVLPFNFYLPISTKYLVMAANMSTQPHKLPLAVSKESCSGCTYIVTGANTGLGFEATKHLVALGSTKVIMAVRNLSLGEEAKAKIEESTGVANIAEVWELDLASYVSVKEFAKKAADLDRIDALIENAGLAMSQGIFAEGHLLAVTVNVISTFLLAVLLLPKLKESAQKFNTEPHLSIVGSEVGFDAEEEWQSIKDDPLVKLDNAQASLMKM